ncbi:phosphoserine phosphatase SerB [Marinomonas mediterranea]|jgi:phosphoserine phosphatase SerB|uniref:Phosphoserine phosphatase n=1 Tax=Marinomonas mediterranea (strain ATCC 700492 / JCM 21426 / NBRC 103028 / MMB-1) TaxID=717774 RepID=F2JUP4_MARM1|nr:phosphoserine phosphatase SerB [Marinomonas mediterranea]ADZ90459.1 phosphoserine phosphatase SerB [Marinomonas mediterranea MMB-1]WCN16639.1 phosphoserine phosphatase SerB [Marinomonas mediterranea MMB-1]
MSPSITLIGRINEAYQITFDAWLSSQSLEFGQTRLSDDSDNFDVFRYDLSAPLSTEVASKLKDALLEKANVTGIDHVLQLATHTIEDAGLAVFDMDSTLIKAEVMDELAVEMGIGEQISAVTASAMRGEIDFTESFTQRLSLLNGLSSEVMDSVYERIVHMDGIKVLMSALNRFGWKTAILSGGFTYFADRVKADYDMTEVHANVLEVVDGVLTGKHIGPIVDGIRKETLLTSLVEKYDVDWTKTIACGDGANDLLMLNRASLGVALHAKPIVREQAPSPISYLGLDGILYLLGMTSKQIRDIN